MSDIKRNLERSKLARESFNSLAKKPTKGTFTFSDLKAEMAKNRQRIDGIIKNHDEEVLRIESEYRPQVARMKLADYPLYDVADSEMNKITKAQLHEELTYVIDEKRKRLNKFMVEPATPEQISLLQLVKMRNGDIPDAELDALISTMASNYGALSTLQTLTRDGDLPRFELPYDIATNLSALEQAEQILSKTIDDIDKLDKELTIQERELLYYPDSTGMCSAVLREIDNDYAFCSPDDRTVLERLKDELETAETDAIDAIMESRTNHNPETVKNASDAMGRHKEIKTFIDENAEALTTDADKAHEQAKIISKANELIG